MVLLLVHIVVQETSVATRTGFADVPMDNAGAGMTPVRLDEEASQLELPKKATLVNPDLQNIPECQRWPSSYRKLVRARSVSIIKA